MAGSDGWNVIGPIVTQRRAPLTGIAHEQHGREQQDAHRDERGSGVPPPRVRRAGADNEDDEPRQREQRLANEVVHRLTVADGGARRGRAVHHHEPEGDEAEGDEDEEVGLELGPFHPVNFCTRRRNSSPRCSKSRNWSKLAHAGESSTISPGWAAAAARSTAVARSPQRSKRYARWAQRGFELVRRLSDEVGGANGARHRLGERREVLTLQRAAEDDVQRRVIRGQRTSRSGGVRGLRVVHVPDAADLGHQLQAVLDAREALERARDRVVVDARGACGSRRRRRVLAVVRAGHARLRRQRVVARELDARQPEAAGHDRRLRPLEDAELRVAVRVERAVAVEVVRLEVQQHRDLARELVDVLELEGGQLADDPVRRHPPTSAAARRCRRRRPSRPASRKIAPSSSTVVVLPFVPVTPTNRLSGSSR